MTVEIVTAKAPRPGVNHCLIPRRYLVTVNETDQKAADATARLDPVRCRFASSSLEHEYGQFAFARNIATNKLGIIFGVPLFSLYGVLDFVNLSDPHTAIVIRLVAAAVAFSIYFSLRSPAAARYHEVLTAAVVGVLSAAMILIIGAEASLDNAYYVGLIQAAVILSFLLRMNFEVAVTTLFLMLAGFILAVSGKADTQEAYLQTLILVTMFSICGFGIYLAERFRRMDFLKTQTIARQNARLSELIADVRLDNARKVAAMNMLVHFVRTPIHQIVGFTDVISKSISDDAGNVPTDCLESVNIIKSASRELSQNVTRLLAYYRLDEKASEAPSLIEMDHVIRDYAEHFSTNQRISVDCERVAIVNRAAVVAAAFAAIVERYSEDAEGARAVEISLRRSGKFALIAVQDDGAPMDPEEFMRRTRALDKLDHYLSANGSSMPMSLRTVARAAQLAGGEFRHAVKDGKNAFQILFFDLGASAEQTEFAARRSDDMIASVWKVA